MSYWVDQNMDVLQQQAVQQLVACEFQLIAAKAVLSEIETSIALNYLFNNCYVSLGYGTCILDYYPSGPINIVIERIHPIGLHDHIEIEFRAFTKKGKPCKKTEKVTFESLKYFKKKPPTTS